MESVSIIISTLNEEQYIDDLLDSLSSQSYRNFEVIVSDGSSVDQTLNVVKKFKKKIPCLRIIISKKRSPAYQRNKGAQYASYNRLLFLDADVVLADDFLEKALDEIRGKKLDIAHPMSFALSDKSFDHILYQLTNWVMMITSKLYPIGGGWALFSTKKLHSTIGGFDEKIYMVGEDVDYVKRAVKYGASFGIVHATLSMSVRRLDLEGRIGSLTNLIKNEFYFAFLGRQNAQKYLYREYGTHKRVEQHL